MCLVSVGRCLCACVCMCVAGCGASFAAAMVAADEEEACRNIRTPPLSLAHPTHTHKQTHTKNRHPLRLRLLPLLAKHLPVRHHHQPHPGPDRRSLHRLKLSQRECFSHVHLCIFSGVWPCPLYPLVFPRPCQCEGDFSVSFSRHVCVLYFRICVLDNEVPRVCVAETV